ncbi:UPF0158 family protein [Alicyclobacillus fastidiosus]|uniref:UPF0158 family protein n=2 Tax=Alicyclobacillus fastidiosus TaxID=392011 RepID=A0ABY6ZJ53_9BACL|nr:UPF0158 family protein [Alicyclobacillus fastidiosus]WAH42964.1 UPF0158 family protein [Alicyclobacillus fastidiosus]GMA64928.1 UPF0158 protein [Alicyclobacillus fastidiosus]
MRSIKTDLNELCDAYSMNNDEIDHFLDVETGEIIVRLDPVLTGERDEEWDEELEFNDRYIHVPKIDSDTAYHLMTEFASTVTSKVLGEALEEALHRRKPFRGFKDVISDFPEERNRWFEFEREAHQRAVLEWLEQNNIKLTR